MKQAVGVIGGVGPMATVYYMQRVIEMTKAGCDQEHLHVIIDSNTNIPDRTEALIHGGADPTEQMTQSARRLAEAGAELIVMPCNTAHYFLPQLQAETKLPFLSMLEATAKACAKFYPGKTAAVLATKGTLATGLYEKALEKEGVAFIIPDDAEKDTLMHLIYDVVKASKSLAPEEETWKELLEGLRRKGADYFILGCTELPIVADTLPEDGPFIDPTAELAKAAIRFCGYETTQE